ncbi:MAG TPA: SMC-Scp complex subunit ScpB [Bacteroidia bacterium]|nr:SMC-Scp complex subunit ScpB [Bacteroidia bacterium]HNU32394.1 SMC-Scp complex subunit ScpB [Bacteroidia bacterium]
MDNLKQNIEALIFTAEQSVTTKDIQTALKAVYGEEFSEVEIRNEINSLTEKYANDDFAFELAEIAGGFKFLSKKNYYAVVNTLLQINSKKRLTTAALETLAIISYKQPISKPEIENIRGVNCDYSIQKLLEKDLIVITGKGDGPGKPILYGISKTFLDHFGLKSARDLPKLKDVQLSDNEIGMPAELNILEEENLTVNENGEINVNEKPASNEEQSPQA